MRDAKAVALPLRSSWPVMRLAAAGVLVVAAAITAFPAHAQGQGGPGHEGPDMMMFGGSSEHLGRNLDRMLDGLNVTEAQRSQIKQVAMAAAADLAPQRQAERSLRQQGLQIFTAPTVDANAAEALRQQMATQHEQSSKRMLQAMLDIANVLTPEQRAKLGERMKEHRRERMHDEHSPRGPRSASQPAPSK